MSGIPPPLNPMRVLHIDDSPDNREVLKQALEGIDPEMEVFSASAPSESIRMMEELQIDCIVSDYSMPEMDGLGLCRKIRDISDVPFIIYTGKGSEEVASVAFEAGADDYIRKEPGQGHYRVLANRVRHAVEKHWGDGLYRNVLENTRDSVIITQGTRIVYANQSTADLVGVSSVGALLETDALDWILKKDRGRVQSIALGRQRGEPQPPRFEIEFQRSDGERLVLEVSSSLIHYKGRPASLSVVRDVSGKVRVRERLVALHNCTTRLASAESMEEIARQTLDSIEEVFNFRWGDFAILEEGRLIPVYYKGMTYDVFETLSLDGPGVVARAARTGESQLVNDTRVDEDYLPTLLDDGNATLSELAVPIKENGNVIGVLNLESPSLDGFSADDQRLLELFSQYVATAVLRIRNDEILKASEEKYRTILESSLDGVAVMLDDKLLYVNQRFADMYGYEDRSEIMGVSAWDLFDPEDHDTIRQGSSKRVEGEKTSHRYELKCVRKDGSTFFVESQTSIVDYEGEEAVLAYHRDITESRRLREESKRYEELLTGFMDSATDGFAMFDSGLNYLNVNRTLEVRSGHPKEYFIGKNILDVLLGIEETGRIELFRDVIRTGNPAITEGEHASKNGQYLSIKAFKVGDGLGVITRDITERKQLETNLVESEARWRSLVALAPDGIITFNPLGFVTSINDVFVELTGFSKDEIVGKHFTKLGTLRVRDMPKYVRLFSSLIKGQTPPPLDFKYRRKNGSMGWGQSHMRSIKVGEKSREVLMILRETSERKRLEEELRRSEERYRSLIELAPDGIMTLNLKGEVTSINTAFMKLTGYSENELVGQHFSKMKSAGSLKDMPKYLKMFASLLRGKTPPLVEFDYIRKDGTYGRGEALSQMVEVGPGKREALAILRDISDRTRMEEQLREYTRNLERLVEERTQELVDAERLVAFGKVSAMVGHDLRGPLVVVKNAVDLARKSPERTDRMLDMIERNAGHAIEILEELRTMTRDEPLTLAPVEVGKLLGKVTEDTFLPTGVELRLEIDEDLPEIVLDEAKTMRALKNIIKNAKDAMPGGGVLTIGAKRKGDQVFFSVSDTGIGITDEARRNLFKPFYTTKLKGMGLGLASTRRMVEVQGGTIFVESKDDEGSTFSISLPLKDLST